MAPRFLLLTPVVLLAALAACGESEEVTPSQSPGETAPTTSLTATPAETQAPPSDATPLPTEPAGWATYLDAQFFEDASFRYPPDWHKEGRVVLSLPTAEWPSVCLPPDQMSLGVSVKPAREISRPEGATDLELDGYTGWQLFEENTEGCPGFAHTVAIERDDAVYHLLFSRGLEVKSEAVFQQILGSLAFEGG